MKSVINGEETNPTGDTDCEKCSSLPEFVVEAPKVDKAITFAFVGSRPAFSVNPVFAWVGISAGATYVAFDAGINIEETTISIANFLVSLGVPAHLLSAKDKLKGGKKRSRDRDYGLPPELFDWYHNGGGKAQHGGQDIGSEYGPSPAEILQEWKDLGSPSGSKPKGKGKYK